MTLRSVYRTCTCNTLRKEDVGTTVTLSGWVHAKRNHGGVFFVDLRDHYGITQIVVNESDGLIKIETLDRIPVESVVTFTGKVARRCDKTMRNNVDTGEIEVMAESLIVQSIASILPFQINKEYDYNEETRLRYRFLDLRRHDMHARVELRSKVINWLRNEMIRLQFTEFQTPILTASSPEGARDFLVPSRIHHGKFYALPQAPQQFKQLLMIAGFDRYFQIAPCFRDEDARADRSPGEFYQFDIEMSFVEQDDVLTIIEPVIEGVFNTFTKKSVTSAPFPRITYEESMIKYGNDKPDLRNPLINSDVTAILANSNILTFTNSISKGSVARAIHAPRTSHKSRSFFDDIVSFAKQNGAQGLAYVIFDNDDTVKGPIAKLLTENEILSLKKISGSENGDTIFLSCDGKIAANKIAGLVRTYIGGKLELINQNEYKLCWIVDFPYFTLNDATSLIDFAHNPFSMPHCELSKLQENDVSELLKIKSYQYDIVCNGIELGSGAIRNHLHDVMYQAFKIVGYSSSDIETRFGGLMQALKFGAPPHGGIAPGLDRIMMLIADVDNIRDVIAFPMNGKAEDILMGAPNTATQEHLKELNIKILEKT